ncbi:Histidine--tRNA ligase [Candidatus Hodgkinia cicadicola]|nr:Histidine--tRNA ligase [Candidatus Hodgkinia cicadicola]
MRWIFAAESLILNSAEFIQFRLDLLIANLCKLFETRGFSCLQLPLIVNGNVRCDLTSAMLALPAAGVKMVYKHGVVLRDERHCDLGRFRQFVQFDFDVFGVCCLLNDIWIICYVYELVRLLACERLVKCFLNVKRVLLGLSEVLGVLDCPVKMNGLLRVLDKSATVRYADALSLLSNGKFDASGDFIPGLGMSFSFVSSKLNVVYIRSKCLCHSSNFEVNSAFLLLRGSYFGEFGVRELLFCDSQLLTCGLLENFVILRPLLSRGLDYYTGAVFEVISEVVLASERNAFVKIGSLIGGGRFDFFIGHSFAVGCSLGITRALTFLSCVKRKFVKRSVVYSVCVCVGNNDGLGFVRLFPVREFAKLGFSVKVLCGLSFVTALKLACGSVALFFRASGGWIVKLMFKRDYLQSRVFDPVLWRSLFTDQFWVADNCLFAGVCVLLNNAAHYYVRL